MNFTIGADPEVFVGDLESPRSIIGLIGGTKEEPKELAELGKGFAVQEDNVALEFNIPASPTKDTFVSNIGLAMRFLQTTLIDRGLVFRKESAISFPDNELLHPNALRFGCDPDYNAWTMKRNHPPRAEDKNLRSCGGHVHIGIDGVDDDFKFKLVRACDLYHGVGSVLMDDGVLRKKLYGKAGACRIKKYGVEYRTLSNFWVFDDALTGWVYDNTKAALDAVTSGLPFEEDADLIQAAINNNDKGIADMLVAKYNINLVH